MGQGVELHPLLVLFGVFGGAEVAGVPGSFLRARTRWRASLPARAPFAWRTPRRYDIRHAFVN
jgi:hypothetical protein